MRPANFKAGSIIAKCALFNPAHSGHQHPIQLCHRDVNLPFVEDTVTQPPQSHPWQVIRLR